MADYYCAQAELLIVTQSLPTSALPFAEAIHRVLPPEVSALHRSLANWTTVDLSPGNITPERLWLDGSGQLFFAFRANEKPKPLMQTGLAAEIAAWLVLLDRWMETFVVIARARAIWTPDELAGALTFLTPAFLPSAVVKHNPNWVQVAFAVALAVADGPLAGDPQDRHWHADTPQTKGENPFLPGPLHEKSD